jgi:ABC-2 type transport system permease protein
MSAWRQAWLVARWEFRRFIKPKQQLVGFLITAVGLGMVFAIQRVAERSRAEAVEIAVVGNEFLPIAGTADSTIRLVAHPAAKLDSLREAVGRRDLRGLLVLRSADEGELLVSREPVWRPALERVLARARQQRKLAEANLEASQVVALLAPVRLDVAFHERARSNRGARLWGIAAVAFLMLALFTGVANVFISITGEKQLRVTEQVVSAIPPQAWIDGKILGLTGVALVGALNTSLVMVAFFALRASARGGPPPVFDASPVTIAIFLLLVVLGCLFWLAAFGAIAATIDDPNSSLRSSLIFLPALSVTPAFMMIQRPESLFGRIAALVPVTSPAALPVRMLLGVPPWWEIALSLVLLLAATWWMRLAAGRIFRSAMLMYGKEAGWAEMLRWARR